MVFIGKRGVLRTSGRGSFHCPHCDLPRPFAYRRVRRFYTLLFVPLVPLQGREDFVQRGFCRHAFRPSVLATGPVEDPGADPGGASVRAGLDGPAASTLLSWGSEEG